MGSTSTASRPEEISQKYLQIKKKDTSIQKKQSYASPFFSWNRQIEIPIVVKEYANIRTIYIINNIKAFSRETWFHEFKVLPVSFQMQYLQFERILFFK